MRERQRRRRRRRSGSESEREREREGEREGESESESESEREGERERKRESECECEREGERERAGRTRTPFRPPRTSETAFILSRSLPEHPARRSNSFAELPQHAEARMEPASPSTRTSFRLGKARFSTSPDVLRVLESRSLASRKARKDDRSYATNLALVGADTSTPTRALRPLSNRHWHHAIRIPLRAGAPHLPLLERLSLIQAVHDAELLFA